MAQWLSTLVAEDLGIVPSTHMVIHNSLTPGPGRLTPSSVCGHCTLEVYIYARKTSVHIK